MPVAHSRHNRSGGAVRGACHLADAVNHRASLTSVEVQELDVGRLQCLWLQQPCVEQHAGCCAHGHGCAVVHKKAPSRGGKRRPIASCLPSQRQQGGTQRNVDAQRRRRLGGRNLVGRSHQHAGKRGVPAAGPLSEESQQQRVRDPVAAGVHTEEGGVPQRRQNVLCRRPGCCLVSLLSLGQQARQGQPPLQHKALRRERPRRERSARSGEGNLSAVTHRRCASNESR
jgi:hypothetical protein